MIAASLVPNSPSTASRRSPSPCTGEAFTRGICTLHYQRNSILFCLFGFGLPTHYTGEANAPTDFICIISIIQYYYAYSAAASQCNPILSSIKNFSAPIHLKARRLFSLSYFRSIRFFSVGVIFFPAYTKPLLPCAIMLPSGAKYIRIVLTNSY